MSPRPNERLRALHDTVSLWERDFNFDIASVADLYDDYLGVSCFRLYHSTYSFRNTRLEQHEACEPLQIHTDFLFTLFQLYLCSYKKARSNVKRNALFCLKISSIVVD